ncbi:MAG: acetylxylan esterase, partial [Abitibacteriaceae bacterium]|nr:acetylxylan esterase [Abditibacteriaceae bacterium]
MDSIKIPDYLAREARRITDRALIDYKDKTAWQTLAPQRRRQFWEMMGLEELLPPEQRTPLNVQVTGVVQRPAYRIEKLYYESLPQLYVTANLYIPNDLTGPVSGVLYCCGHSAAQKVHYQAHPRRFAELGFVCLIVETIQLGEVKGHHHGCYLEGWFDWYSRGYTPAAIEMLSGIRGLDLLSQRSEVDASRLGVTGISGGGATTWWVAAVDERVRVAVPVCSTGTLASHLADGTIDTHCDCMWWINSYGWDLADVGGIIAPRPLMIASANRDALYTIESIREVHSQLQRLYETLEVPENLQLIETPGPHSYHKRSRTAIFSWFLKHLQGKEVPPEKVGDIDESKSKQESEETLRAFVNGSPQSNRALTIQDEICLPSPAPQIADEAALAKTREEVVSALRQKTFAAFPASPVPLDVKVQPATNVQNAQQWQFAFSAEEGVRLRGQCCVAGAGQCVVALCQPDEALDAAAAWIAPLDAGTKIIIETRSIREAESEKSARRGLWKAVSAK